MRLLFVFRFASELFVFLFVVASLAGFAAAFAFVVAFAFAFVVVVVVFVGVVVAGAAVSVVAGASGGSTAPPCATHAFQPPSSGRTFLKPWSMRNCAARALVCSLGQAQ